MRAATLGPLLSLNVDCPFRSISLSFCFCHLTHAVLSVPLLSLILCVCLGPSPLPLHFSLSVSLSHSLHGSLCNSSLLSVSLSIFQSPLLILCLSSPLPSLVCLLCVFFLSQ